MDLPESAYMNPFQLFPITRLLHFGPYLRLEVCSSRQSADSQEAENSQKNYIKNTEFSLGLLVQSTEEGKGGFH